MKWLVTQDNCLVNLEKIQSIEFETVHESCSERYRIEIYGENNAQYTIHFSTREARFDAYEKITTYLSPLECRS